MLEFGDKAADSISKYFNCIMLSALGVLVLGIPIALCLIFGIPLITTLSAWFFVK